MSDREHVRGCTTSSFEARPRTTGPPAPALELVRGDAPAAPARPARPRSMPGYLVMPRPKDAVKGLLMPFTFALAVVAGAGASGWTVVRALVVWAALELLVYPARYQWNDIRGFVADQRHPSQKDRGRLPGPMDRARAHVAASSAVAVARLAAVAVLALALPGLRLGGFLLAVTVAVFGVAIVYEALRARGSGRTGAFPPPVRPAVAALWLVVGAGYVVRGMTGLALAVDLGRRPALAVSAGLALWAFGTAFVTSRWVTESLAFATADHGRPRWTARADQGREHLLALTRWLPSRMPRTTPSPAEWAPLRGRTPPAAPWNAALLTAAAAAAATGVLLTAPHPSPTTAAVATGLGAAGAAAVILSPRRRLAVVAAGAVLQLLALLLAAQPRPPAALLPWLALMAAHLSFSSRSLSTMGAPSRRLRAAAAALLAPVCRAVIGRATWEAVRTEAGGPR
ncbi:MULTISPECIES: hypothetical protein [Streptomyces]|uniref:hypothetical protein n=1 Tax=Streptomyces TaxID=1883 RepID=UPI00140979E7|nr:MULTISPECIES: hypothetical protein [Streptomyces]MDH6227641.1 hypothetical protein [Streptomyces sp. MJP52]